MKVKHFVINFLFLSAWSTSVGMFLFMSKPNDWNNIWFIPWIYIFVTFYFYVFLSLVWLALDYNKYLEQKEKENETV